MKAVLPYYLMILKFNSLSGHIHSSIDQRLRASDFANGKFWDTIKLRWISLSQVRSDQQVNNGMMKMSDQKMNNGMMKTKASSVKRASKKWMARGSMSG
jgi:hypothetical protein